MPALVLHCRETDFDAATQTCAAPFWSYPDTIIPTLSIADAQTLAMSIAYLLAIAWAFRMFRRVINETA